ncbi:MAG: hypothetical protein ABEJ87_04550 [Candidatus Nanohalobium sp.]
MEGVNLYLKVRQKLGEKLPEEVGWLSLSMLLFSTLLMFQLHSMGWSWDFSVYSMIGEYMFHGGFYMEWLRPPVASTLMGLLQFIMSQRAAEYVFILLSALSLFYSSLQFSREFETGFEAFYILMMTPVAIFYSTMAGTEMLSLAFAMMFLADLEKPERAGLWLGLAFLTRYNYGLLIPLTLLQLDFRKYIKTGAVAGLLLVPWLVYNYVMTGSFLTSFGNFLMLNVFLRYTGSPIAWENFLFIGIPSVLMFLLLYRKDARREIGLDLENAAVLLFGGLTVISYVTAEIRSLRYLYPLILPIGFYAEKAYRSLNRQHLLTVFLLLNIAGGAALVHGRGLTNPDSYQEVSNRLDCMAESGEWVYLNYAGLHTKSTMSRRKTFERISEGWRSVTFKNRGFRNISAPVLIDTETYRVYGVKSRCKDPIPVNDTYLSGFNERTGLNYSFKSYVYDRFIEDKLEAFR